MYVSNTKLFRSLLSYVDILQCKAPRCFKVDVETIEATARAITLLVISIGESWLRKDD